MKRVGLDVQRAHARILPETINDQDQTVEICWSTGSRVLRWDWDIGYYWEELSMDPAHILLDRMNNGAVNFLDAHNDRSMDNVLGTIIKGWVSNGEGRGTLQFSVKEKAQEMLQDYKRGVGITNSVGYNVLRMELVEKSDVDYPVYRVTLWEPLEVSAAPVPADPKSSARSNDSKTRIQCEIIDNLTEKGSQDMGKIQETTAETTVVDTAAIEAAGVEKENKRVMAITAQVRKHKDVLPADFAERMVKEKKTVEEVNSLIIDELATRQAVTKPQADVHVGSDVGADAAKRGVENALLVRTGIVKDLSEEGRDFAGYSMLRMAEEHMKATGKSVRGLSSMKIAERALHSDSDFPLLLSNLANKHLLKGAGAVDQSWRELTSETSVSDFKDINGIGTGEITSFEELAPGGEYKYTTLAENGEKYRVKTFGKAIAFTRQMLMNDDLRALTEVPNKLGAAAARTENELFYSFFEGAHTMADGVALFHNTHKNLGSNTGITNDAITKLMQLIEAQKDGNAPLELKGQFIIAPVEYKVLLQQLLTQINATKAADINIHAGLYKLITSSYLTSGKIFAAASKDLVDLVEVAYINGQKGVYLEEQIDFKTDGVHLKARIDVGMKPMSWKGLSKVTIS